jgi:hypothetical protein
MAPRAGARLRKARWLGGGFFDLSAQLGQLVLEPGMQDQLGRGASPLGADLARQRAKEGEHFGRATPHVFVRLAGRRPFRLPGDSWLGIGLLGPGFIPLALEQSRPLRLRVGPFNASLVFLGLRILDGDGARVAHAQRWARGTPGPGAVAGVAGLMQHPPNRRCAHPGQAARAQRPRQRSERSGTSAILTPIWRPLRLGQETGALRTAIRVLAPTARRDQQGGESAVVEAVHQAAHARSALETCGSGGLSPGLGLRDGQQGSGASHHVHPFTGCLYTGLQVLLLRRGHRTQGVFLWLGHDGLSSLRAVFSFSGTNDHLFAA